MRLLRSPASVVAEEEEPALLLGIRVCRSSSTPPFILAVAEAPYSAAATDAGTAEESVSAGGGESDDSMTERFSSDSRDDREVV